MMLRMPSACAPISSAWSAIRFLSREVKWISVSMPTCWRIMIASDSALMRTRAIGLSPMLTASAPASLTSRAPAMHFDGLRPRGGSISTLTTKLWAARRLANGVGGSCSAGVRSMAIAVDAGACRIRGAPAHGEGGAAFEQRGDLFLEGGRRLGDRDAADRLELLTDGADRPRDKDWLARDLARLARKLDGPEVDIPHPPFQAVAGELDPVGTEGIGFDQLGAGRNVRSVNFLDDFGLGEVELVEGALEADAAGMELGAHGAVAQEGASTKPLEEGMEPGFVALGGGAHGPQ